MLFWNQIQTTNTSRLAAVAYATVWVNNSSREILERNKNNYFMHSHTIYWQMDIIALKLPIHSRTHTHTCIQPECHHNNTYLTNSTATATKKMCDFDLLHTHTHSARGLSEYISVTRRWYDETISFCVAKCVRASEWTSDDDNVWSVNESEKEEKEEKKMRTQMEKHT